MFIRRMSMMYELSKGGAVYDLLYISYTLMLLLWAHR